jgi:hypothetical protein
MERALGEAAWKAASTRPAADDLTGSAQRRQGSALATAAAEAGAVGAHPSAGRGFQLEGESRLPVPPAASLGAPSVGSDLDPAEAVHSTAISTAVSTSLSTPSSSSSSLSETATEISHLVAQKPTLPLGRSTAPLALRLNEPHFQRLFLRLHFVANELPLREHLTRLLVEARAANNALNGSIAAKLAAVLGSGLGGLGVVDGAASLAAGAFGDFGGRGHLPLAAFLLQGPPCTDAPSAFRAADALAWCLLELASVRVDLESLGVIDPLTRLAQLPSPAPRLSADGDVRVATVAAAVPLTGGAARALEAAHHARQTLAAETEGVAAAARRVRALWAQAAAAAARASPTGGGFARDAWAAGIRPTAPDGDLDKCADAAL